MKYEIPVMELVELEATDVITLSVGGSDYDPTIEGENGNPWA